MSVTIIKLELAELALKAKRLDESEQILLDIILDRNTDEESLYSAWIAMGSIKMIKVLKNSAIFSEVEYCYKKAYSIKSNELTLEAYLFILSYFFKTATETIELSKVNIKGLQVKAGIDLLVSIGSAYILKQRGNSLLTNVVGLVGLDYGVKGIIGDINSIDGYEKLINYLNLTISEIIDDYNKNLPLNDNQLRFFEDEITNNNLRKFLSADKKDKIEVLNEFMEEAVALDINFKVMLKNSIIEVFENGRASTKNSDTRISLFLNSNKESFSPFIDTKSKTLFITYSSNKEDAYFMIFSDNKVQFIHTDNKTTLSSKKIIISDFFYSYDEFFKCKIDIPLEKDEQNIKVTLPNEIEINIFEFTIPFKASTKTKQIEMVKKMISLFQS
jgi:hypothetical protein